jgi:DNA-binding MarR family transcriptional regulator
VVTEVAPETSSDELNLGLLLFIPYRAMEQRVYEELARAGFNDITPAQGRVFQRIGPAGTRLTDLAEAAQVTKQTAGFLVDHLERAGYVERVPDPNDARARLVQITPRGARAVQHASTVVSQIETDWAAHLGPQRTRQLRQALTRLRQITDPYTS